MDIFNKTVNFLKEVLVESRKVNWPTAQQVWQYTLIVVGISVVLAAFLGGVDFAFTRLLDKFLIH